MDPFSIAKSQIESQVKALLEAFTSNSTNSETKKKILGIFVSLGLIEAPKEVDPEKKEGWALGPLDSVAIKDKLNNLLSFTSDLREKLLHGQNLENPEGENGEINPELQDGEYLDPSETDTNPTEVQSTSTLNESMRNKFDSFLSFTNVIKAKLTLPEVSQNSVETSQNDFESNSTQPSCSRTTNELAIGNGNGVESHQMPNPRQSVYFQKPTETKLNVPIPNIPANLTDTFGDMYNKTNAFVGRFWSK